MAKHTLIVFAVLAALLAPSAAAPANAVVVKANLTGKYLRTTSKGSGTATITFTGGKVCWKFTYRGLDKPGDSGIHIAPPPAPGKHKTSVFPFTATTSMAPGCVAANHWGPSSAGWAQKIAANPSRFYVIIGTAKYPQGAIGGPLRRAQRSGAFPRITAADLDDAMAILRREWFDRHELDVPPIQAINEDVDVSELPEQLRPHMNPPNWRGMWFPRTKPLD